MTTDQAGGFIEIDRSGQQPRVRFENFLAARMGQPPSGMSIERNDNAAYYDPGNCR